MATTVIFVVAIVLVLTGLLLGWTLAQQAFERRGRNQAEAQRQINLGWEQLRRARQSLEEERRPEY